MQLLQHPVEALLGDLQDVEKLGDVRPGLAVDEVQHAVMRPPEAVVGEDPVGVADEVAIGEEQQLDEVVGRLLGERRAGALPRRMRRRACGSGTSSASAIYVSHVDIFQADCYSSRPSARNE